MTTQDLRSALEIVVIVGGIVLAIRLIVEMIYQSKTGE